jgi:predicted AlkP superfamily pyrophosphatase or phosphodiesterase
MGRTWDRLLSAEAYDYPDQARGEGSLKGETNALFPHKIALATNAAVDNIMPTPFGNEVLLEFAEAAIDAEKLGQGAQPDLLSVSFSSVDYCGHTFGPYSQEVQDIVLRLDLQLQEFFAFLDKKVGPGNVVLILTADHGVAPTPEFAQDQGLDGLRLSESNLLAELKVKLNDKFGPASFLLRTNLFEGNLYLDRDAIAKSRVAPAEISSFIRDWALSSGKFAAAYSREQLLDGRAPGLLGKLVLNAFNPERSGDMILIEKPYALFGGKSGTTHGTPYAYDTHVPVILYGATFKPGRYADEFYVKDIVPTICAALHLSEPPGCMGKPFVKILAAQ